MEQGQNRTDIIIREINPESQQEISLVALRMRQTLVEVLGEDKGTSMYSIDWLKDRVLWHLDPKLTTAKIFLIEDVNGNILGHAIARIEQDHNAKPYGYFSTIFVEPNSRSKGMADRLVLHVEEWLKQMNMPKIIYNTADNHTKIIRLFNRHGFQITYHHAENKMVQLTKVL